MNTTSNGISSLTSSSFQITQNETMVIATHSSLGGANVTSITDTIGNAFTRAIRVGTSISEGWMDVWSSTPSKTTATDIVTVNWSVADIVMAEISIYKNVAGIGNSTAATGQSSPFQTSLSTTLVNLKSGAWFLGVAGTNAATKCLKNLTPNSPFVTRVDSCSGSFSTTDVSMFMSDNATTLRNHTSIFFNATSTIGAISIDVEEVELLPTDLEPLQFSICNNYSTSCICNTTGDTCHLNTVTKSTGANVLTNIVLGTTYCTGITTAALTTTKSSTLELLADYYAQSRNTTGAVILLEFFVTTTAPPTTFGSCTPTGTEYAIGKILFSTSGTTLTTNGANVYTGTIFGDTSAPLAAAIYYGNIVIVLQVCPSPCGVSGTISFAQWGSTVNSAIQMRELG